MDVRDIALRTMVLRRYDVPVSEKTGLSVTIPIERRREWGVRGGTDHDKVVMKYDPITQIILIAPPEVFENLKTDSRKNDLVRDGAGDVHKKSLHAGNCPSVEADCENTQPGSKVKENMRG